MKGLHLIDNPAVMVIPFVVTAYNLILFRTFFAGINPSMRESARIDGAGEFLILIKIILPLSKPIIAAIALFTIVGKWNDWYSALIYLNTQEYYPVQMILRKILFNSTAFNNMDPSIMRVYNIINRRNFHEKKESIKNRSTRNVCGNAAFRLWSRQGKKRKYSSYFREEHQCSFNQYGGL